MGSGKVVALLGAGLAAAVAAGIWFAMSDPALDAADPQEPVADVGPASGAPKPADAPRKSSRKHAKTLGSCEVLGTVLRRAEQKPATGQVVELVREGTEPWTAAADDGGNFRFEKIPDGGPYELRIECKGFATVRLPGIELARSEKRDVGTLWLDQAVQVSVSVRTWADQPVQGAVVEAFAAPDTQTGTFDWSKAAAQLSAVPVAVVSGTTDESGRVLFPEVASGVWTFAARKEGLARDGRTNVRLKGGETAPEIVIYLATGHTLKGRVLDADQKPLTGVTVLGGRMANVWDYGAAALRVRSTTGPDGAYELTGLPSGDVGLLVARPGTQAYQAATVRVPNVKQFDIIVRDGGTLTGTVTDAVSGKPIDGAVVRATSWAGQNRTAEATTDAEGKYLMNPVPEGAIGSVTVTKDGWLQDRSDEAVGNQQIQVPSGETSTRDLKMRQGAKVSGTVTGPDGPVGGARVQVWTGSPDRGVNQSPVALTDAAGHYEIGPVDQGTGMVRVSKEGYVQSGMPENWWMALQQGTLPPQLRVEVPESGEARLDLTLERGATVEGTVESAEGPVAGATITVWSNAGGGPSNTRTKDDGSFLIEGLPPGQKVNFQPQREGYLPTRNEPVQVLEGQPTTGVKLMMVKQSVVRGTVTAAGGEALRDAQVTVVMKQSGNRGGGFNEWDNMSMPLQSPGGQGGTAVPVHPDGTFEAPIPFAEGSFAVRAQALDLAAGESAAVEMTEGREVYEASVVLEAGYAISGHVTGKGVGLPGASVTLGVRGGRGVQMPADNFGNSGSVVAVTDDAGTFVVEHAGVGKYVASANAEGYVRKSVNDVSVPTSGDVTIDLDPALEITGRVQFADGKPAPGAIVNAQQENPESGNTSRRFRGNRLWGGGAQSIAGPDGTFRIRGLATGSYRIMVQPPWDNSLNFQGASVDSVAAGRSDVQVLVQEGGTISGTVQDPDGKGIGSVWVYANPVKPDEFSQARGGRTKADGTFEIAGLGAGPYNVNANPPQFGEASRYLAASTQGVAVGSKDVTLKFDAGLSIEGQIVDSDGKPVRDANLQLQPKPDEKGQRPNFNWNRAQTSTDAEGRFRFVGLTQGKYGILLQAWQGSRHDGNVLSGGDDVAAGDTGVRMTMLAGVKIAGVIVDETGQAIANAWINANPPSGMGRNARSDKNGSFEITGLPAGQVTVNANAAGRPPVNLQKVDTGNLGLRIEMPKGGSIAGRVLDASGAVYANQNLQFKKTDGGTHQGWAQTNQEGRFNAQMLPEGTYEVSAYKQDDGKWTQVKLGSAKTGEDVELRIP